MRYYLIVHDLESYRVHHDLVSTREPDKTFRNMRKGDRILYYAKWDKKRKEGKKLVGVFRVSQEGRPNPEGDPWKGHGYPIEPILLPPSPLDFEPSKFRLVWRRAANAISEDQYRRIVSWILGFEDFSEQMNHDMVIALFAKIHSDLGYPKIQIIRSEFPDCIAFDNKGRKVRIEFEPKATDFDHEIDDCDKIVCWENDWGSSAPSGKIISIREWFFG
jgi:hypothetical protein